jgi:hypothetical protein
MTKPSRTPAGIEASRRDESKCRGPNTPEGKRRSVRKALTHRLLAHTNVLGWESTARFRTLLASLFAEHQPHTPTETGLDESIAIDSWCQMRARGLEKAGLTRGLCRAAGDDRRYSNGLAEPHDVGRPLGESSTTAITTWSSVTKTASPALLAAPCVPSTTNPASRVIAALTQFAGPGLDPGKPNWKPPKPDLNPDKPNLNPAVLRSNTALCKRSGARRPQVRCAGCKAGRVVRSRHATFNH